MIFGGPNMGNKIVISGKALTIEDVCLIAEDSSELVLSEDPNFIDRIDRGAKLIDSLLAEEGCVN